MCSPINSNSIHFKISSNLKKKNELLHIYPREMLKRIPQEEEGEKEEEKEWGGRGRRNYFELVIKKNCTEKHSLKRYPTTLVSNKL